MSAELPGFVPRKLVYRAAEVAELLGLSTREVQRKMAEGAFGDLKRAGGSEKRPFYKITYDGLLLFYQDRDNPIND
ncbi:MAG: hypothetical protein K9K65_06070 [Desulfarculaceae bacterium]|nr:hypothetical protein [Desulfarculaceae bacterium]MCF8097392.1 hypothetical protein [Desulfarculaceae bacterium]MCF8123816.1 hypothetical protein [Desulfarculaceae bacterium]